MVKPAKSSEIQHKGTRILGKNCPLQSYHGQAKFISGNSSFLRLVPNTFSTAAEQQHSSFII